MTRKAEIGIAIGVLALLIVVVLAFMLRSKPQQPAAITDQTSTSTTPSSTTPSMGTVPTAPPAPASVQTTTMIFVERFSSYSSESNFENVTDVLPLTTASLGTRLQTIARDQRAATGAGTAYYGISTKVISQKVEAETDATASIVVSTQRAESIGSPGNTTVRYQDITVKLVKQGDTWKVDDFTWGK